MTTVTLGNVSKLSKIWNNDSRKMIAFLFFYVINVNNLFKTWSSEAKTMIHNTRYKNTLISFIQVKKTIIDCIVISHKKLYQTFNYYRST